MSHTSQDNNNFQVKYKRLPKIKTNISGLSRSDYYY